MVAAWEPGDTEKGNDADSMKETEKETEETEDTKKPGNNEITTLFQLLHAENRNLRWK